MIRNFTRLFIGLLCFVSLMPSTLRAQQIQNLADNYYYNNFDGGALGSAFVQIGGTAALSVTSPASSNNLVTGSGHALQTIANRNGGTTMGFINSGTNLDNEPYGFEWTFLYRNTSSTADNSDNITNGSNLWKFWLQAESADLTTTRGYYLTQKAGQISLRYKYSNSSDPGQQYALITSGNLSANTTYVIRVQRLRRQNGPSSYSIVWHLFIDQYTASAQQASTEVGSGAYENTVTNYNYSALLTSATTTGRFKFDEFKMYSMKLEITGANDQSNGISNPLYRGQVGAILYGLQVKTRGYFDIYQIKFNVSGSITSIIQANTMYLKRSADNYFGSPDDTNVTILDFYDGAAQQYNNWSTQFWSIGDANGDAVTAAYYFIQANVRSDASLNNSYTFVGAPELISSNAQVNYVSNGDVTNTVAPPASSGIVYDWQGTSSTQWATPGNWSPSGIPGVNDVARIGVVSYASNNHPLVTTTANVGNVIIGTAKASPSLTVDGTLNITGSLTQNNAPNTDFTSTLAGSGTLTAANLIIGNKTVGTTQSLTASNTQINVTLNNVTLSGSVILNSMFTTIAPFNRTNNSSIVINSGDIFTVRDIKSSNTGSGNMSAFSINGGTLKLTGATPFSEFSATGATYILTPTAGTSTIEYAATGAVTNQTVDPLINYFANLPLTLAPTTTAYSSIAFSGTASKNVAAGTMQIRNNWNSTGGKVDLLTNSTIVNFDGTTTQSLVDAGSDGGNGVFFKDVNISGGASAAKTMSGAGKFSVAVGGNINVTGNTILNAGGVLYLKSSAAGFANVGQLTGTSSINGNTNVEVFISGAANGGIRGTRIMGSPVNDSAAPKSFYNYLKDYIPVTGPGGVTNGFDQGGTASPYAVTLQFYNESATHLVSQFTTLPNITSTTYTSNPGIGKGVFVFFRGSRTNMNGKLNAPFAAAENVTAVFTGPINKGNVTVPVTFTSNSGDSYNGFNVISNPYPATISWDLVQQSNTHITNQIVMLKPGGGYMSRVKVGSNAPVVTNATGAEDAAGYIQPGQGFYIKKTSAGGNTNIVFQESHKAATGTQAGRYLSLPEAPPLFSMLEMGLTPGSIMANGPAGSTIAFYLNLSNGTTKDEAAIVFNTGSNANYDGDDAPYLGGGAVQLSTLSNDGVATAINVMPELGTISEIKLNVNATATGPVSLNFTSIAVLGRYSVYLKDNFLNTLTDIKASPTYNFTIDRTIAASYGNGRFVLVFESPRPIGVDLTEFDAVQQGTSVSVSWKTTSETGALKYEVERSANGQTFARIGEVAAAGNSSVLVSYRYADVTPLAGKNYYRLKQLFADGSSSYSEIKSVNYNDAANVVLTTFKVEKQNGSAVLTWTTANEAGSDRFDIEHSNDGTTFSVIGNRPAAGLSNIPKDYSFDHGSAIIGTNYYRLKAVFTDGTSSFSEVRSVVIIEAPVLEYSAFTITQLGTAAVLNWKTLVEKSTDHFEIERSANNNEFIYIGQKVAAGNSSTELNYNFNDSSPLAGQSYYRLKQVFADNTIAYSDVKVFTYVDPLTVNFSSFTAVPSGTAVALAWTTSSESGSVRYEIERSVNSTDFIRIGELLASGNSTIARSYNYTDAAPVTGPAYYRLKIIYNDGTSSYSSTQSATYVKPLSIVLSAFTGAQVNLAIALNWTSSSEEGGAKFELERAADGVTFSKIGDVTASGNSAVAKNYSFNDQTPLNGANHYRLKQVYTDGTFSYSTIVQVNFVKPIRTDFSAFTVTRMVEKVVLAWSTATEDNTSKFELERTADGVNFVKIGEVNAAGNSAAAKSYTFNDGAPVAGKLYYRVKQVNNDGQFAYSDVREVNFIKLATVPQHKLMVFPNPTVDKFEINMGGAASKLTIYTVTGKPMKNLSFADGEPVIAYVTDLPTGLYLVEVKDPVSNKIVGTAKFFKN